MTLVIFEIHKYVHLLKTLFSFLFLRVLLRAHIIYKYIYFYYYYKDIIINSPHKVLFAPVLPPKRKKRKEIFLAECQRIFY